MSIKAMTKEAILKRLIENVGVCPVCNHAICHHEDKKILPLNIKRHDIMRAININEKYGKEHDVPAVKKSANGITVHRCK
jgi:hypothetical protein